MMNHIQPYILRFILLVISLSPVQAISDDAFRDEILRRESAFNKQQSLSVGDTRLYGATFTFKLYGLNDHKPLWTDAAVRQLAQSIQAIEKDGLKPEDYLLGNLKQGTPARTAGKLPISKQVDLDLLHTEAFLRATYNLLVGKVDPESLDPDFNFSRSITGENVPMLLDKIRQGQIEQAFDWARPDHPAYARLKKGLEKYRAIAAAGGWQPIAAGPTLKPGQQGERVIQLKKRLSITGDYDGADEHTPLFNDRLADAVEQFQRRHSLDIDGAVGKQTLEALNVPVEARIDQIRVSLERLRWYLHAATDEYLVVDIAAFKVYWIKDNERIWEEDVQVGKQYTHTPVFKDKVRYLEFNPTWTIPPGIMKRTILPNLKKDPDYLDKKGYLLLKQDGTEVDPASVDWASMNSMPYLVRQPPGKNNALGLVKFMFPNKHAVYLHDTNHRELFNRAQRTFSSGCVRVNNPFDLAERLLADQAEWNSEKIEQVVASEKTTRVNLKKPIRIIIAYTTALSDGKTVSFRKDIYQRDPAVLKGLNGEFKLRKQDR